MFLFPFFAYLVLAGLVLIPIVPENVIPYYAIFTFHAHLNNNGTTTATMEIFPQLDARFPFSARGVTKPYFPP